ncbi:hypothetical protein FACS1894199_17030 [Bacteroidia bacterium]|nr:hypothetical protein FACS1894199_17030 [Bacteroidia bacterium]
MHKRIKTTVAKAKALRIYVEPLLTRSKTDDMNSRRLVFSYLGEKLAVTELFQEVAPKIATRPGGYTRILRVGHRIGDNAEMCIIELVDYNATYTEEKKEVKKGRRSRRGASGASKIEAGKAKVESEQPAEVVEEDVVEAEEFVEAEVVETEVVEAEVAEVAEAEVVEEPVAEVAEEEPKAE